ncbi:nucleotidyltransferase isoform X2 [Wolffia australiana]
MGNQEVWDDQDHSLLNGLLPNEARVTRVLDADRWSLAEARIDELVRCIQPNTRSEDCRNAVVNYVQRLIAKCFSCQVFTFGSVPLKTYLPDGDIDMSAFSNNLNLKDTWANEVRDVLENEEKSENAEFRVKEVQYIQAEVKIIKCLVENIVVDISFNQLGGLCTLCFLEEIDQFINQDHLFKRSIILIKAWCYYESRILGAHHGLISTYALEILVLYIFHVFNNSFTGPLEVLYRFLEFFSNFDWENFCVSLWGPVPVSSLPDISAEPPRKDAGDLLLNKYFLDNCSSRYSVSPGGQENQGQPFISKFFNVIDPLRTNNNLGRSVSKGNFFRIRSAFAFGAKRLAALLECPKEDIISEINMFFMNTWQRHGNGRRPDASGSNLVILQPSDHPESAEDNSRSSLSLSNLKSNENLGSMLGQEYQTDAVISSQGVYRPVNSTSTSRLQGRKTYGSPSPSRTSDQVDQPAQNSLPRPGYASSESGVVRFQFSRTRSSPELTDSSSVASVRRQTKLPETIKRYITSARPELATGLNSRFQGSDSSDMNCSSHQSFETASDSSRGYPNNKSGFIPSGEDFSSISEALMRQQEEQDLVNLMGSSAISGINGQVQLPFPLPPSVLASMGDPRKNLAGILPGNIPLINHHGGPIMQFSPGLPPSPVPRYFHGAGLASSPEEIVEDENGFWPDQTESVSRSFQRFHSDERHDNSTDGFTRTQLRLASLDEQEAVASSRSMANAQASSSRSKSSENSKLTRDRRGRKPAPAYVASKKGGSSQYEESDEHKDWIALSHSHGHHLTGFESAGLSGSDPAIQMAPMFVSPAGSQSRSGDSNGGVMPFAFYPTGPPVPFLTMLPFCNFDGPVGLEDCPMDNGHISPSEVKSFDLGEEHSSSPGSVKGGSFDQVEERKGDILNSDFVGHLQNLQYGRFCQDTHYPGPVVYPSPMMFPPVYLQGHFPWDGPGRPLSSNVNLFPVGGYGPRLVPVASAQLGQSRQQQPGVFQRYGEVIPRYRAGTGTYLPNPKSGSYRDRQSSRSRNQRGNNYSYERSDHADREGSWTSAKTSRTAGRGQSRSQSDKTARVERPNRSWDSLRGEPAPAYQAQGGSKPSPSTLPHGTRQLAGGNGNGVNASVMMLYPYEPGRGEFAGSEQLEFGSLRPVHLVGAGDGPRSVERGQQIRAVFDHRQTAYDPQASPRASSPEHPSSPQVHRR